MSPEVSRCLSSSYRRAKRKRTNYFNWLLIFPFQFAFFWSSSMVHQCHPLVPSVPSLSPFFSSTCLFCASLLSVRLFCITSVLWMSIISLKQVAQHTQPLTMRPFQSIRAEKTIHARFNTCTQCHNISTAILKSQVNEIRRATQQPPNQAESKPPKEQNTHVLEQFPVPQPAKLNPIHVQWKSTASQMPIAWQLKI